MRKLAKIVLPLLVLALALGGAALLVRSKPAIEAAQPVEQVFTVEASEVAITTISPTLTLYGEVVARRMLEVRPLVPGKVSEVSPELIEGGRVQAGNLLLRIDDFLYASAHADAMAQLDEARARLDELRASLSANERLIYITKQQIALQQAQVDRSSRLAQSGNVSERARDEAELAVIRERFALAQREEETQTLQARIRQQEARIAQLEVMRNRTERDLEDTVLRAPFAGNVADVSVALGKQVNTSDVVAKLVDDAELDIRMTLNDDVFGRLWRDGLIGREVQASWRLGERDIPLQAEIVRVEAEIDPKAGGVEAFAVVTGNPENAPLRPGAFVTLAVPDAQFRDVVRVPRQAVVGGDTVFVIEDERLVPRPVEVVGFDGEEAILRGDLAPGELINITRMAEIGPGLKVRLAATPLVTSELKP
ncbi:MAG: efflux RND transporter periplasmic adaptor subunit [Geminicoccaceae bacterium]